jgi:hypothetical protein
MLDLLWYNQDAFTAEMSSKHVLSMDRNGCLRDTCISCLSSSVETDAPVSHCVQATLAHSLPWQELEAVDAVALPLNSSLQGSSLPKWMVKASQTQTPNLVLSRGTPQGLLAQDNLTQNSYRVPPFRDRPREVWDWDSGRRRFLHCRTLRHVLPQSGRPMNGGLLTTARNM